MENKKTSGRVSPVPRASLLNPELWRPDWLQDSARDPKLLWLDKNENRDPQQLALVRRVVSELDPEALATYPNSARLYRKLGGWAGVDPRCLLLTPGSDGAIRLTFETFVSPGESVIITAPTFAMYPVYSRMFGAKVTTLEYHPSNNGPVLRADEIVTAVRREHPRLVCIPNPDSPTGTTFNPAEMRSIIEAASDTGAVILIDEAYYPFHRQTVVSWISEFPHLVVVRTTAKAWGMAGLRIGYAVAHPNVAKMMHKMRPMYECSTIAIAAFEAMLDHAAASAASVARLEAGKRHFLDRMEQLGFHVLRGKGNFMHVAFGASAEAVHAALAGVCYYRKDFKEPCLKGYSRFSSTTVEGFAPVIAAIENAMGHRGRND